jgi:hypothetical protein
MHLHICCTIQVHTLAGGTSKVHPLVTAGLRQGDVSGGWVGACDIRQLSAVGIAAARHCQAQPIAQVFKAGVPGVHLHQLPAV